MKNGIVKVEDIPQIINAKNEKKSVTKISKVSKALNNSFKIENNRFLYLLNQIPIISHALKYEKGFTAVIPEEFKEGLKNGTLRIMKGKDGSTIATIVDSKGAVVHPMRLKEFTKHVNPAEMSQVMNQICMQIQLEEMQKNISEFRIETNSKLNEILKSFHDDRIAVADSLRYSFERFQKGEEISRSQLLSKIDDAKASLFTDIKSQIDSLSKYRTEYQIIDDKKNDEIQTRISFILEAIDSLQVVFLIECYLQKDDKNKCYEITIAYSRDLLKILNIENLELLNGLSDFSFLNLNYNIWEEKIIPQVTIWRELDSVSKRFLVGGNRK